MATVACGAEVSNGEAHAESDFGLQFEEVDLYKFDPAASFC
jgi:hypothetical protein